MTYVLILRRFAMKEIRLILAMLVRRYELELVPGQSHAMRVYLVPYFTAGKFLVGVRPSD